MNKRKEEGIKQMFSEFLNWVDDSNPPKITIKKEGKKNINISIRYPK